MKIRVVIVLVLTMLTASACIVEPIGGGHGYYDRGHGPYGGGHDRGVWRG